MSSLLDIEILLRTVQIMNLLDRPLALFYDATRARVLDVLLSNDTDLSGRAIARQAGISPTTANLALGDLSSAGIVSWHIKGKAYLWKLRQDSSLVEQMRSFAAVKDIEAGEIVANALGSEPLSVIVFGSAARGESTRTSDLDILVVAHNKQQGMDFRRMAFRASAALREKLGRPVEITVVERDSIERNEISSLIAEISRDGRTLRGKRVEELVI